MRYRLLPLLAALALLVSCGDDDDAVSTDETTTTTTARETSTTASAPSQPVATAGAVARVIVQLDDQLRRADVDGSPCIDGPHEACVERALEAYEHDIAVIARNMVEVLPRLAQAGSDLYQGQFSGDLIARLDTTVTLGGMLRTAHTAAIAACLPDFGGGCDEANEALELAIGEALKDFNTWRHDYHPVTDPSSEDGAVTVPPES